MFTDFIKFKKQGSYLLTWEETRHNFPCILRRFDPIIMPMCKKCYFRINTGMFSWLSCTSFTNGYVRNVLINTNTNNEWVI